ncbi:division plane positioning ATPase MipZ [Porphyromonas somerae]|uniref:division plane positioning ATPase MipZ n=1 Tax=Porphyromonas somerae TaxID=322095 RepID=UPI002A8011D0|nr:division plane positioning ATPase MipZ [Porphyromonas somerae]MDY3883821.1 division plane positioning ATPase MipZ [Porphyromonas somerae]
MEKRKIRIAVSGIKGGTGKSTVAMFLGLISRELYGKTVCLVDCDEYQETLSHLSKTEETLLLDRPNYFQELNEKRAKKSRYFAPLPVEKIPNLSAKNIAEVERRHSECDLFIFDTKGSEVEPEFMLQLTQMDYIIVPLILDNTSLRPSYMWIRGMLYSLRQKGYGDRNKGIMLLFNKYNVEDPDQRRHKEWWVKTAKEEGLKVIKSEVFSNELIGKGVDRSGNESAFFQSISIVPEDGTLSVTNIAEVVKDIIEFIDGPQVENAVKARRVAKERHVIDNDFIISKIDELLLALNKTKAFIQNNNVSATQLRMIEEWIDSLGISKIKYLMEDVPYMPDDPSSSSFFPLLNKEKDSEEVDEKENDDANEKRTPEELEEASELSELDRRAIELFTKWLKEQKE